MLKLSLAKILDHSTSISASKFDLYAIPVPNNIYEILLASDWLRAVQFVHIVHRRLPPSTCQVVPKQFAGSHLDTWVERGNVRVKCFA